MKNEQDSKSPAIPPLPPARGSAPSWYATWDYEDNSMWEAASPYTDDGGSPEFYWRLKQRLVNDKIEWYDASDADLMADSEDPRTWETLDAAKADIAKDHAEIIAEAKAQNSTDHKQ